MMRKLMILLALVLIGCTVNQRNDEVRIGMSEAQLIKIKGKPYRVARTRSASGIVETWYYPYYDIWLGYNHNRKTYVTLINGRVSSITED